MILLPAIDLMGGRVVRLRQGRADERTDYGLDPVETALRWQNAGGDWLHVVDLDAAFSGASANLDVVARIASSVSIPCELGGGLRTVEAVRRAFEAGAARAVIGTRAAECPDFVRELVETFGGDRIAVGIDARDGRVAVRGWTASTGIDALDFAQSVEAAGARTLIYTDIATDGMMAGPNFPALDALLERSSCNVIASGGVSSLDDLRQLAARPKLHGVIIGKALYEGSIDLAQAAALRHP